LDYGIELNKRLKKGMNYDHKTKIEKAWYAGKENPVQFHAILQENQKDTTAKQEQDTNRKTTFQQCSVLPLEWFAFE
jgi:hypothetical protein